MAVGQGRDDIAYAYACFLVRDLALSDQTALAWLEQWDKGNSPPKGTERLLQIITSAHQYGRNAYGSGLTTPSRRGRGNQHRTISFVVEVRR